MKRRILVSLVFAFLISGSGCLSTVPGGLGGSPDVPDGGDSTPAIKDHPAPPDKLTAETAGQFAATYEAVTRHNALLRANDNIVELGTNCNVVDTEETNGQYRVSLECGHWYEFHDNGNIGIADGAPYRASYVVSDAGVLSVSRSGP